MVRLVPSSLSSESIEIALAGQTAEQSLQAMQRSSPFRTSSEQVSPESVRNGCFNFRVLNCDFYSEKVFKRYN